jgi:putative multiple sugar transport system substrate-binding protein
MKFVRLATMSVALTLTVALAACGSSQKTADQAPAAGSGSAAGGLVGVTMPTKSSERWIHDGDNIKAALEKLGYTVDLQYAENDIPTQVNQIENQITRGAKLLVIASIDGTAITTQLQEAKDRNIPVIAYDRLIRGSKNVDFYVSFDNYAVGVAQANALLVGLGLKREDGSTGPATGPFNIELFSGSPDDNNSRYFFDGAMDTLKPYLDKGTLKVRSGQTTLEQTSILRWQQQTAEQRMEDLLTKSYNDGTTVDGVLSPNDGLSRGILTALQDAGYGKNGTPLPAVTGQDAEIASVKLIAEGIQSSTIFKDTRKLAAEAVVAAQAFLQHRTPPANDTTTYDNGVRVVPAYLLPVVTVFKDDIQKDLIDTGYWTAAEIRAGQALK